MIYLHGRLPPRKVVDTLLGTLDGVDAHNLIGPLIGNQVGSSACLNRGLHRRPCILLFVLVSHLSRVLCAPLSSIVPRRVLIVPHI